MKEKLVTTGTLVCLVVLSSLLVTYALVIFPGVPAIRWFLVTSAVVLGRLDFPAWVQAVGSVAAILVAVAVPWHQRRQEVAAAKRTAVAVAMVIGAEVSSKVDLMIACAQAVLFELKFVRFEDPRRRAQLCVKLLERYEFPVEDQVLHLAPALPEAAARIAYGVASMRRVRSGLEFVARGGAGNSSLAFLGTAFAANRLNVLMALRALRAAQRRLLAFTGN